MLSRGQLYGARGASLHLPEATLTEASFTPHARLPAHAHELPNLLLIVEGSFDETFGARERTCGPRRLFFRPAGERHSQRFLARGATCLTIEMPMLSGPSNAQRRDGSVCLDGVPALIALRIYDEMQCTTPETSLIVEELSTQLASVTLGQPIVRERRHPQWLARARDMIEARADEPVRLRDVADAAGVHRVHLSRTFRQFFGCGVGEYVRRLRVHAACRELRGHGRPVSTIAADVGFSDESHMGRAFREVMSRSPRSIRESRVSRCMR